MTNVTITGIHRPPSVTDTILMFDASTDTGRVVVGIDHRPAMAIVEALAVGEHVEADVESWQILAQVTG